MPLFCDECGKPLNPSDDGVYHESGDSCGAYCPEHHPLRIRDEEIQEVMAELRKLGIESADLDELVQ
jgi:hypothetical protein